MSRNKLLAFVVGAGVVSFGLYQAGEAWKAKVEKDAIVNAQTAEKEMQINAQTEVEKTKIEQQEATKRTKERMTWIPWAGGATNDELKESPHYEDR